MLKFQLISVSKKATYCKVRWPEGIVFFITYSAGVSATNAILG